MGNEQSARAEEAKMTPAEVQRLLNQQRQMYEKKCKEYMEKAAEAQNAQKAQASPSPQPAAPPPTVYVAQPVYVQQPMPVPQPAYKPQPDNISAQGVGTIGYDTERQRTPNSYAREDLKNVTDTGTSTANMYPNLNNQGASSSANSYNTERQRSPYNYERDDLQNAIRATPPPNIYPNLNNQGASSSANTHLFNFKQPQNNNPNSVHSFVFVDRNGHAQRPPPSAPMRSNRDRSLSRSRNNQDGNELNCPTCRTIFGLQIYQCNHGHSSCSNCKQFRRPCGICGNDISDMRNFSLEGYVAEKKVPCPNSNNGCMLVIKMLDMDAHVNECPFKELKCPAGCTWKGKLKELSAHFDSSHPNQRSADVGSEMRQDITNCSQQVFLVLMGAFNFLFHVKVSPDRSLYMTAQLIGTKISASKWSYEIHIYNKNESRRKYTFTDVCTSFVEPVNDIFKESKCSVLNQSYASTFVNNGALTFKFFIKKTLESKPRGDFNKNQRGKGRK